MSSYDPNLAWSDFKHAKPRDNCGYGSGERHKIQSTIPLEGSSWASQLLVMLYKNYLFLIRSWKLTALVIFSPVIFISLLILIDLLPRNSFIEGYTTYDVGKQSRIKRYDPYKSIPRCTSFNGMRCKTIRYACKPSSASVKRKAEEILKLVSEWNDLEAGDVEWYSSEKEMRDFIYTNPNTTQNAVVFQEIDKTVFDYIILYNATYEVKRKIYNDQWPDERLALQAALDRAYLVHFRYNGSGRQLEISFSTQDFPRRFSEDRYQSGAFLACSPLFFYSGLMIQFVFFLFCICQEKDLLLRQGLKMMGLRDSVYWMSWTTTGVIISSILSLTTVVTGYIYSIYFYTNVPFLLHFVINIVFSMATLVMAFFISVFVQSSRASMTIGIMFYFLGIIMMATYGNEIIFCNLFLKSRSSSIQAFCYIFTILLPPHGLARIASGIHMIFVWNKGINGSRLSHGGLKLPSYTWNDFINSKLDPYSKLSGKPEYYDPDIYSVYLILGGMVLLILLTWYFDNVIPSVNGKTYPWNFFVKRWYWNREKHKGDVNNLTDAYQDSADNTVRLDRLVKVYPEWNSDDKKPISFMGRKSKEPATRVVDGLSLTLRKGEIFCLLGHNGAGKSTTIRMLTGLIKPDEGDAWIFGKSIRTNMDDIRKYLGVCPQHDILWDDLTAREHIYIVSVLKNVPRRQRNSVIRDMLEQLQLVKYADQRVGAFSGGMKRRLSVGLAFIGNSRVVFLDEPTTGMDPIIRRQIWQLILRQLEDRVVLMTTHTMEEADVLAKHIAVMGCGKILTEGSPVSLKNKHSGYIIDLYSREESVMKKLEEEIKSIGSIRMSPLDVSASSMVAQGFRLCVTPEDIKILPNIIEFLEQFEGVSFNMMQSTLEDAFVQVTNENKKVQFALIQAKLERLQFAQYEFHRQYNQLLYQNERLQRLSYAHARTFSASNDASSAVAHNNQVENTNSEI